MGTTPVYGLPYPDGTDLVIEGDDAMQALAAGVEGIHVSESVVIGQASMGSGNPANTPRNAEFPGTVLQMDGFTYATGVLTRTGPPRLFLVYAEVEIKCITSVSTAVNSTVNVHVSDPTTPSATSFDSIQSTVDISSRQVIHNLSVPMRLITGDTVTFVANSSDIYTIERTRLRVYPIGPQEA